MHKVINKTKLPATMRKTPFNKLSPFTMKKTGISKELRVTEGKEGHISESGVKFL
jgi:hypothetical protein